MKTTVSSKGQIVLPAEIRKRDGIVSGQEFVLGEISAGVTDRVFEPRQAPAAADTWFTDLPR